MFLKRNLKIGDLTGAGDLFAMTSFMDMLTVNQLESLEELKCQLKLFK